MASAIDAESLQSSELFQNQPLSVVETIVSKGQLVAFGSGQIIFNQGDPGDRLYIVKEGVVEVVATPKDGSEPRTVAYLGQGEVIGELALLTGSTRSATVRAPERAELFTVEAPVFLDLLGTLPSFARNLCVVLARRLEITTLNAPASPSKQLQGNLRFFDLATVMQTLISSHQTGVLTVRQ